MKPDWGHGPNLPVEMFTEEEIHKALDCLGYWPLDSEQVIEKLRERRGGSSAAS